MIPVEFKTDVKTSRDLVLSYEKAAKAVALQNCLLKSTSLGKCTVTRLNKFNDGMYENYAVDLYKISVKNDSQDDASSIYLGCAEGDHDLVLGCTSKSMADDLAKKSCIDKCDKRCDKVQSETVKVIHVSNVKDFSWLKTKQGFGCVTISKYVCK